MTQPLSTYCFFDAVAAAMEFCRFSISESIPDDEVEGAPLALACSPFLGASEPGSFFHSEDVCGSRVARFVDSNGFVRKRSCENVAEMGERVWELEP